jgi:hypothetical protein
MSDAQMQIHYALPVVVKQTLRLEPLQLFRDGKFQRLLFDPFTGLTSPGTEMLDSKAALLTAWM